MNARDRQLSARYLAPLKLLDGFGGSVRAACRTLTPNSTEELAAMLQRRYALTYDPLKEILVTVGVSEGVDLAMRTIIDPGDEVISPDPGYVAYEADIIFAGGVKFLAPCKPRQG